MFPTFAQKCYYHKSTVGINVQQIAKILRMCFVWFLYTVSCQQADTLVSGTIFVIVVFLKTCCTNLQMFFWPNRE